MTYLPLAASVPFIMSLVAIVWVLSALLLIGIILIQKGKGGGLSGAFGGMGAGGLLGTKTGDFLTWVTIGLVATFLGLGVIMVRFYRPRGPVETPREIQGPVEAPGESQGSGDAGGTTEGSADTPGATEAPAGAAGVSGAQPGAEDAPPTDQN